MADVAQMENLNNMNARNIAMVFAPNMTQKQFILVLYPTDAYTFGHSSPS
ncbi:hypothetical protein JHK85_044204 [Glycine max]|nr:hypothetical protein JHK85_044204 [Glycine max]